MNPSSQQNQNQNPLLQLVQQLMQGQNQQNGNAPLPQGKSQGQGAQVNQLYANLLQTAFANNGQFNAGSSSVPHVKNISPLETQGQHGILAQAVSQALQNGADPGILGQAFQSLGGNQFIGMCEAFVEQMTKGKQGLFPSAIAAWNGQKHQSGTSGMKAGDTVYFDADAGNGYNGHTGIYEGNGNFLSATNNGIREYNINDWENMTGQKLLGYVSDSDSTAPPMRQQQQQQPQTGPTIAPIQQPKPPYQPGQRLGQKKPQQQQQPQQQPQQQAPKPPIQWNTVPKAPMHTVVQNSQNPLQTILGWFS